MAQGVYALSEALIPTAEAGQAKRLKPLLHKVVKIYADKAKNDKENGDLYRKYGRQPRPGAPVSSSCCRRHSGALNSFKFFSDLNLKGTWPSAVWTPSKQRLENQANSQTSPMDLATFGAL